MANTSADPPYVPNLKVICHTVCEGLYTDDNGTDLVQF